MGQAINSAPQVRRRSSSGPVRLHFEHGIAGTADADGVADTAGQRMRERATERIVPVSASVGDAQVKRIVEALADGVGVNQGIDDLGPMTMS